MGEGLQPQYLNISNGESHNYFITEISSSNEVCNELLKQNRFEGSSDKATLAAFSSDACSFSFSLLLLLLCVCLFVCLFVLGFLLPSLHHVPGIELSKRRRLTVEALGITIPHGLIIHPKAVVKGRAGVKGTCLFQNKDNISFVMAVGITHFQFY